MATTFHPFPLLPWELRALIWEHTVEPRTVDVHAKKYRLDESTSEDHADSPVYVRLVSTTPVPAVLHACREARDMGLYQKGLSEVEVVPEGYERRYLWLNFDIDTIDVGEDDLFQYKSAAHSVKRLKWKRRMFRGRDFLSFRNFTSLIEAHIDCIDDVGIDQWCRTFGTHTPWRISCDRRNIYLIESEKNNRTITAEALQEEYERDRELDYGDWAFDDSDTDALAEYFAGLDLTTFLPNVMAAIWQSMLNNDDN